MVHSVAGALAARLSGGLSDLLALALPSRCLVCAARLETPLFAPVCRACWRALPSIGHPFCPRCGTPYPEGVAPGLCGPCRLPGRGFRRARAAGPYDGALKVLLHELKYRRRFRLARALGQLAFDRCLKEGALEGAAVVPVPLHWRRRRERGYNQAELLAKAIAAEAGLARCRALKKTKHRPPQAELSASGRRRNARGAYCARLPAGLVGEPVILVDDVFTTGATAEACARALRRAGAAAVDVITVARVP